MDSQGLVIVQKCLSEVNVQWIPGIAVPSHTHTHRGRRRYEANSANPAKTLPNASVLEEVSLLQDSL